MLQYQENRERYIEALSKPRKSDGPFVVFVCIFGLLIILFSVWNAVQMTNSARDDATQTVDQVTTQIAYTVDTDVEAHKTMLKSALETLKQFRDDGIDATASDTYMQSYLGNICNTEGFDYLILQRQGRSDIKAGAIPSDINALFDGDANTLTDMPAAAAAIEKGGIVAWIEGTDINYAEPIYENDQLAGVLVGGIANSNLQRVVGIQLYRSVSSFCIVSRKGELLLASGNERFDEVTSLLTEEEEKQVESDLANGKRGTSRLTFTDDQAYYFSYAPLSGENWMMLTLTPASVFADVYTKYMWRALFCAAAAALALVSLVCFLLLRQRANRWRLEELAFTDETTGGLNNTEFMMRYGRIRGHKNACEYAIVLLDIRDFKLINETVGYEAGDQILRYVYNAIVRELDEKQLEFAARSEMDHYYVCLHENTPEGIQARIDRITERVNTSAVKETFGFSIEFTQSACIVTDPATDVATLQDHALIASQRSDYSSLNHCVIFSDEMQEQVHLDRQLDHAAEEALREGQFKVYFQPKVSMSTNQVKGAEALVRWQHPTLGLLAPGAFLPVLEKSGRVQELDFFVYSEVCRWLAARQQAGKPMFPVSVNLSRTHFWKDDFLQRYVDVADKYGVDHGYIEFELTETVFMDDNKLQKIKAGIAQMHSFGFRCSVDDFGVGFSSLSLINQMDVDTLKFDRSFFLDLKDKKSREIVNCLFSMAEQLKLGVIVEGIETQEQIDYLRGERCDVIQGYYYSRPLPEEEFNSWVESFNTAA